ncbi:MULTISPECIES: LacI family DNA-binding transcriptional regulator [unclassified Mesorhizobium]|uniref:LacI family DNA-binding transcriptional regulator n=1 Tax=unclassified Mesorhizobium TaxID=325217 RepID=UPI000FCC389B|nr:MULTISPECIES: LacI family DNA-binding transcriptional regulator [unclassified Mesorhizobium]TGP21531.1 LacI family transcriptional regulator [Mesorhizobium sp. M1D.F.Ca.ET.231.01.1.1]TGP28976.1 LacI family transcriptional regulator [Mesorhizobium sp. M1D.F.Ca.ET.234.01.1.1]TGS43446.1 LacI family transcriptional regulator [Mesorhizobium sp. M1D.F.Ca.ET.184.01.1.1]TGS59993.1 LacI family transcriptional regulator [Mesorhizobium sp. M1D.F.Ca.ET.183.01.1.1]
MTKKPPTIRDVARLSGVSTATVSRFFSGKESVIAPETVASVRTAAQALGYTPSEIGRSLRLARSNVVMMLVPDATNPFTADVAASVEQSLNGIGLSMVLANASENADQQDRLLADAEGLRARAVILQGAIDTPRLREMALRRNNLIFVNRRPAEGITAPYVGIDNFAAGVAVGRYFSQQGYQNYVAIHGPRPFSGSIERLDGFLEGLGNPSILQFESSYKMEAGYHQALNFLADRSRRYSVFCGNDMIAYGVYRAAAELNVRVPEDLVIFGFDDNRLNEWLAPWLTTVKVPAFDFGPAVAALIEGPGKNGRRQSVILPFELKIRRSA